LRLLSNLLRRFIRQGTLRVRDADGHVHIFGDTAPGPDVSIHLRDRKLYTKLFINPELYAAEAYMDGTLTLENGAAIHDFLLLFSVNRAGLYSYGSQRLMRRMWRSFLLFVLVLSPAAVLAQQEGPVELEVPNPMGPHTWFIILAVGAFLAWAISYTLDVQKETLGRKKDRQGLLELKEELLGRLAALETSRESGAVAESRYRKQHRELRQRLSKALEQLGAKKASDA